MKYLKTHVQPYGPWPEINLIPWPIYKEPKGVLSILMARDEKSKLNIPS
jgi:hypothetical protein